MSTARRSAFACLVAFAACTPAAAPQPPAPTPPSPSPTAVTTPVRPGFDVDNVTAVVRFLAGEVGPRETTSAAYRRAASYVETRFRSAGYHVSRRPFRVEGGMSNFAPVQEGDTFNVVAAPAGFDLTRPHLVVGAHLDTVPQAPGAVDNAAGIGIVLELARLAALEPTPFPVVFIAFGGEESRVPTGGLHGSRAYVTALSARERRAIAGAVSIDRVGTGSRVPICTASRSSAVLAQRFVDAARRAGVAHYRCTNGSSDHASFAAAGIPAVRIGPDEFAEYHTARDRPTIFVPAQAARAGALMWELLRSGV